MIDFTLIRKLNREGFPNINGNKDCVFEGDIVFDSKGIQFVCHQGQYCNAPRCSNCPAHRGENVWSWYRVPRQEELQFHLGKFMLPLIEITEWGIKQNEFGFTFNLVIDGRKIDTAGGATAEETHAMAWIRCRDYFIEKTRKLQTAKELGFDIYGEYYPG